MRFDGVRFTGFDAEPDATLSLIPPRTLFATADGCVWITTSRGGLLRWHRGRLARVWEEGTSLVSQIADDGRGGVLIARGTEVWQSIDDAPPQSVAQTPDIAEHLRLHAAASPQRARPGIPAQLRDRRNRVWTAAPAGRLSVADSAGGEFPIVLPDVEPGNRIGELTEDREGNIWAATGESGLVQIRERRANVLTVADGLADRTAFVIL